MNGIIYSSAFLNLESQVSAGAHRSYHSVNTGWHPGQDATSLQGHMEAEATINSQGQGEGWGTKRKAMLVKGKHKPPLQKDIQISR